MNDVKRKEPGTLGRVRPVFSWHVKNDCGISEGMTSLLENGLHVATMVALYLFQVGVKHWQRAKIREMH